MQRRLDETPGEFIMRQRRRSNGDIKMRESILRDVGDTIMIIINQRNYRRWHSGLPCAGSAVEEINEIVFSAPHV